MPIYNYICNSCGVNFSLIIKKCSKKMKPKCKRCGSKDVARAKGPACSKRICPNFV